MSYTELEFVAATEAGLPRLVFLLDENAALPIPAAQLQDDDPGLRARQQAFRDRLRAAGIMTVEVASPEQLEVELVLDNFETPWTADPLPVEALLRTVAAIAGVGFVGILLRGGASCGIAIPSLPALSQVRRLTMEGSVGWLPR